MATAETTATRTADKAQEKTEAAASRMKSVQRDAANKVENFAYETQQNMSAKFDKFAKSFEGMSALGQHNMDAFAKSSEIAARAAEGIGSELQAFSKKSFEDSVSAAQDLASAKTLPELIEKQSTFAQQALEGWMHQATKMNEIYVAAAKDIIAPIGESLNATTDRMKRLSV